MSKLKKLLSSIAGAKDDAIIKLSKKYYKQIRKQYRHDKDVRDICDIILKAIDEGDVKTVDEQQLLLAGAIKMRKF